MAGEVKNFDSPDETRPFEGKGQAEILNVGGKAIGKGVFEPGWKWSENVKPIAQTDSCQAHHVGHCVAGSLHVVTDEGSEFDIGVGDAYEILPGHEAWVVGDATYSALEFQSETADKFASS